MNQTLYRKYRPQNFAQLVGQNHIKLTLQNQITSGQIVHAYLFAGPRGIGKTTTARLLAKALNCEKRKSQESEPCNKCFVCQAINNGNFFDLLEIDAASNRGINEIRELREHVKYPPSRGKYKIFIVDEVHMLTPEAFNALLKTLEEPPAQIIFILATTEVHQLPETIVSRCQRFDFKKVNFKNIVKRLDYICQQEKVKVDKPVLELIARRADGFIRDAEGILGQIISLGEKKINLDTASIILPRSDFSLVIQLIDLISKKQTAAGLRLLNQLINEGIDLIDFNRDVIEYLRKLLLLKMESSLDEFSSFSLEQELNDQAIKQSKDLTIDQIVRLIEEFIALEKQLKTSDSSLLPFELTITRLSLSQQQFADKEGKDQTIGQESKQPEDIKPTKSLNPSSTSLKVNDITQAWPQIVAEVKKYNHSLPFILKVCVPGNFDGKRLQLCLKYKIHQEKLKNQQLKQLVEQAIEKVTKKKVLIEPVLNIDIELPKPANATGDNTVDSALEVFDGKIIE